MDREKRIEMGGGTRGRMQPNPRGDRRCLRRVLFDILAEGHGRGEGKKKEKEKEKKSERISSALVRASRRLDEKKNRIRLPWLVMSFIQWTKPSTNCDVAVAVQAVHFSTSSPARQ